MAKMYSRKGGVSGSTKPAEKKAPTWVEYKKDEVEKLVLKLRQQKYPSAMIGTILRDQYGIPSVQAITGKKIVKILKENDVDGKLPEDIHNLIKKAVNLAEHMKTNKNDVHSMRGLQLTESKVRRLAKYYKANGRLAENWKYERSKAKLMVQ